MKIPDPANRTFVAYIFDDRDALPGISQSIPCSAEYMLVTYCMQIGEALAEFNLLSIHSDGAEGGFIICNRSNREVITVDTQIPPDTGFFKLQEAGGTVGLTLMYNIFLYSAKDPG
jgi:hypothetical protein